MSNLRSNRAQRRAARVRNTRIVIILILVVAVAIGVFFAIQKGQQTAPTEAQSPAVAAGEMITTQSGLQYQDLVVGTGSEAVAGKSVSVHYTGWLEDGTKFDSSLDRGQPFTFTLGAGQVIPGWDEGVAGMKVGGKRKLVIPPDLGYGSQGAGGVIPPNATLIFEVELLEVK
jgi:FKBP-type peptidyl-prolyl cis-trans isomerase